MRNKGRNKQFIQQAWNREYSHLLTLLHPEQAGRIDWDQANYFYRIGKTPREAVSEWKPTEPVKPRWTGGQQTKTMFEKGKSHE